MTDDELLNDLQRVLNAMDAPSLPDPTAAKAALAWNSIDAELALLEFDSELNASDSGVLLRGAENLPRQLTFTTDDVTIEMEIGPSGLIGQILPPQAAAIELYSGNEQPSRMADADEFGVFQIQEFEPGPTAVVARALDGSWSIRTAWTVT